MFTVVQTRKSANRRPELFVAPTKWINCDKICWPLQNFNTLAHDPNSVPDQSWPSCPFKNKGSADTFEDADAMVSELEYEADSDDFVRTSRSTRGKPGQIKKVFQSNKFTLGRPITPVSHQPPVSPNPLYLLYFTLTPYSFIIYNLQAQLLASPIPTTSTFQQQQPQQLININNINQEMAQISMDNSYFTIVGNQPEPTLDNSTQDQPSQSSNILLSAMSRANLATYDTIEVPVDMQVVELPEN